jgi:hypothetical protein
MSAAAAAPVTATATAAAKNNNDDDKMDTDEYEVDKLIAELYEGKQVVAYLVQWAPTTGTSNSNSNNNNNPNIRLIEYTMEPVSHIYGDKLIPNFQKANKHHPSRWFYYLDKPATWGSGQPVGWHEYPLETALQIENNLSNTITLKSGGKFSYEINGATMTQKNTTTGTVRPIRRLIMIDNNEALPVAKKWDGLKYQV